MGLLSAMSRRGAQRIPYNAIRPHMRLEHRWQGAPQAPSMLRYLQERSNGPMAMGMADLADRTGRAHSLPLDMGLAALGGAGGIVALNQLALQDRAITPEQRREAQRLRAQLSALRRAEREQGAREFGWMTGLEQSNDQLASDVYQMDDSYYEDRRAGRR